MPRITVTDATTAADLDLAMEVWAAANRARRRPAGPLRTARVREKLEQGELVLLASYGERVAGMALAETFVDGERPSPDTGHISMVLVDPALWGSGIGRKLIEALQSRSWRKLSVWTRPENRRELRLYTGCGFVDTGHRAALQDGDEIMQLMWTADAEAGRSHR